MPAGARQNHYNFWLRRPGERWVQRRLLEIDGVLSQLQSRISKCQSMQEKLQAHAHDPQPPTCSFVLKAEWLRLGFLQQVAQTPHVKWKWRKSMAAFICHCDGCVIWEFPLSQNTSFFYSWRYMCEGKQTWLSAQNTVFHIHIQVWGKNKALYSEDIILLQVTEVNSGSGS